MCAFTLRRAPWDPNNIVVHAAGDPVDEPPLYSISVSRKEKPKVVMFYSWDATPADIIGNATFSESILSSSSYLTLRERSMKMKESFLGGEFSLAHTPTGPMKWKADLLSTSRMKLYDRSGKKLAKVDKPGSSGEKKLDLISDDPDLLELVLLTYFAALTLNKAFFEIFDEVVEGIFSFQ
ncbi:hypothetical protein TRICI_004880 [Trichomonascus ciferrii]|uniref:Uncharacterized protein n=1 Tax=Trichomonascus ciferrii TaxID=44093 RepID=A0A642V3J1_9ASCO|nr:hypothetical protein TRICI_004880 [Trichomonascus ciferrii]